MSQLDHAHKATEYLAERPSGSYEEFDYVARLLKEDTLVKHFTANVKHPEWVRWFCRQSEFAEMVGSSGDSKRLDELRRWCGRLCMTDPNDELSVEMSRVAIGVLSARRVSPDPVMVESVLQALSSDTEQLTELEVSWLMWVVQGMGSLHRSGLQVWLLRILKRCDINSHRYAGLVVLRQMLSLELRWEPIYIADRSPRLLISRGGAVSFLGREDGGERLTAGVVRAWIDAAPEQLLDIAAGHVEQAFQQLVSFDFNYEESVYDSMSTTRSAIETHPQDSVRTPLDDVIDTARDSLVRMTETAPQSAGLWIDRALQSDVPLLRRVAVHGLTHDASRSADERMQMVQDLSLLDDVHVHHEVFNLLAELASRTSADALGRFVGHLLAGLQQDGGESETARMKAYAAFKLLRWLQENMHNET